MGLSYTITYDDFNLDLSASKSDPVMKQIADFVAEDIKRNIRHQKEFDGIKFDKLSDTRINRKRKMGYPFPNKALIATGRMLNGISAKKVKRGVYSIRVDKRLKYKSGKTGSIDGGELSEIHQVVGAGRGRITRAFIGISKRSDKFITQRINRFVREQLTKSKKTKVTIRGKS